MSKNFYSKPNPLNNNDIQNYSKRHILSKRENNGFFIKRNLKVNELKKYPLEIAVYEGDKDNQTNLEKFKGILWSIEIQNRKLIASQFTRGCSLEIYFHELDETVKLLWKPKTIPIIYPIRTNPIENHREEYRKRLGHNYCRELVENSKIIQDIPKKNKEEVLFLFTTDEIKDKAFLITSNGNRKQWKENILIEYFDDTPLILSIPGISKIDIFITQPINKEYRFELEIKSFNNITLKSIPFYK